jgi:hypothetical protein
MSLHTIKLREASRERFVKTGNLVWLSHYLSTFQPDSKLPDPIEAISTPVWDGMVDDFIARRRTELREVSTVPQGTTPDLYSNTNAGA